MPDTQTTSPQDSAAELERIGNAYAEDYPDIQTCARQAASELITRYTGQTLDPDRVYWHRFAQSNSSTLTFTGWEHHGQPEESLTLTQLVIQRFSVQDQINRFDLNLNSGFYLNDAEHGQYDERNEVKILPKAVLQALWDLDFNTLYRAKLEQFYEANNGNGRLLAKSLFFKTLFHAYLTGVIDLSALRHLAYLAAGLIKLPPDLTMLRKEVLTEHYDQLFIPHINGLALKGIIGFSTSKYNYLYFSSGRLLKFGGTGDVYEWFRTQAARPDLRQRLLEHFSLKEAQDTLIRRSLTEALDSIRDTPWSPSQKLVLRAAYDHNEDVFTYLQRTLREQDIDNSETLLSSNRELRLRIFNIELAAFLRLSAGLAPGDAVLAGVTLGVGLLGIGLSSERMLNGDTAQERKLALRRLIGETIAVLFTAPALRGPDEQLLNDLATLETVAPESFEMTELAPTGPAELSRYRTHDALEEALLGTGRYRGVYVRNRYDMFVRLQGGTYKVRYIDSMDQWVIVDPAKPEHFFGSWPIDRDVLGEWVRHEAPLNMTPSEASSTEPVSDIENSFSVGTERLRALEQYHVPNQFKAVVHDLLGIQAPPLIDVVNLEPTLAATREQLFTLRRSLATHSQEYLQAPILAPRPRLPELPDTLQPSGLFKRLYKHSHGVVLGEESGSIASKKLLIKNLGELKSLGVHTLYIDALLSDLQQEFLDVYLHTRVMTPELKQALGRLDSLNAEHANLTLLIKEARRQAVKVRALNCSAAYGYQGLVNASAADSQRMVKYFGYKLIEAHQSVTPHGKWIALVNNMHAFEQGSAPGLAELTGTTGVRIKDVFKEAHFGIYRDTGELLKAPGGGRVAVKGDLRIDLSTLERRPS